MKCLISPQGGAKRTVAGGGSGAGRTVVNAEHADGALLLIDAEDDRVPAGAVS